VDSVVDVAMVVAVVVVVALPECLEPPVSKELRTARKAKRHVLHNKYVWRRVRRNITPTLGVSRPMLTKTAYASNLEPT